jgi:hypothetical protein
MVDGKRPAVFGPDARRGRQPGHVPGRDSLAYGLPESAAQHRPHDPDAVGAVSRVPLRLPQPVKISDGQLGQRLTAEGRDEVQAHRVHVIVLRRLGDGAGQVDGQPAIEEGPNGKPVIWDNAAVHLLVDFAEFLGDLGAGTARDLLANRLPCSSYPSKRGAYGAAGAASASALGLGRPARRTPATPTRRAEQLRLTWHIDRWQHAAVRSWRAGGPARGHSVDGRSDGPSHAIGVGALSGQLRA